ncbi:MAG: hypothetical protein ACKVHR_15810 [Pirellulales bacterium]
MSRSIGSVIVTVIPLNMAFTTQHLFMFVAAASVATLLSTQFSPTLALLITVCLAAPLVFLFPISSRRPFFYGGIAGTVIALSLSSAVLHLAYINVPREPLISRQNPTGNGELQIPRIQRDMAERVSPFAVTLGFVFGAATSLIISRPIAAWLDDSPQLGIAKCVDCGRMNAESTRICPRCMNRIDSRDGNPHENVE